MRRKRALRTPPSNPKGRWRKALKKARRNGDPIPKKRAKKKKAAHLNVPSASGSGFVAMRGGYQPAFKNRFMRLDDYRSMAKERKALIAEARKKPK